MEYPTYLIHYGVPGQKWGVRRWQNEDGSLTSEGYEHYYGNRRSNSIENINNIASSIKKQVEKDSKPPTGNQNCQLCTWSAEAQFRGIKNAAPRPVYSPRDPELRIKGETIVKNPEKTKFSSVSDIKKTLDKIDGDARFYVHVNWSNSSGGHEFLIIKDGSKKYIMDPQAGHVSPLSEKSEYFSSINYKNSYMSRLDNKEFNASLYNKVNNRKNIVEFNPELDLPYMYKEGMISKEEYLKEMSSFRKKH